MASVLVKRLRRRGWVSPGKWLEWYPPLRVLRVRVLEISRDWRRIRVLLPLSWRTRNPGGSMFGGAMAALADPIAALACCHRFPEYAVWTRLLELDFRREARGDLELRFELKPEQERGIAAELEERGQATPTFEYAFYAADGVLCASVRNTVAIRRTGYRRAGEGQEPERPQEFTSEDRRSTDDE